MFNILERIEELENQVQEMEEILYIMNLSVNILIDSAIEEKKLNEILIKEVLKYRKKEKEK